MPFANRVIALLEKLPSKQTMTLRQISGDLNVSPGAVISLFELFGIQPANWESPSDYESASILESLTRHETARRTGRNNNATN
jgi:hypothetical protein